MVTRGALGVLLLLHLASAPWKWESTGCAPTLHPSGCGSTTGLALGHGWAQDKFFSSWPLSSRGRRLGPLRLRPGWGCTALPPPHPPPNPSCRLPSMSPQRSPGPQSPKPRTRLLLALAVPTPKKAGPTPGPPGQLSLALCAVCRAQRKLCPLHAPNSEPCLLLLFRPWFDQKNSATALEEPRQPCKGLINANRFDDFSLKDTAKCFSKCAQSGDESCNLGNLQRYWLNYEIHLVEKSLTETVNMSFLTTLVKNISTNISEDLHFSLTPSQVPKQVTEDRHQHPDRVRLPRSLFESLQGSRPVVRLAITILDIGSGNVFKGPRLSLEDGSSVLNDHVVGLSLGHINVTGLAEPLEITFSHKHQPPNMTLSCVFWDVTKGSLSSSPGSSGDWSSKGCSTDFGVNRTICRCDHLTFFALLLRPILDQATVTALTRISQAGCGTSMIFLAFTIVLYAVLRFSRQRFKSEDIPKIHVALSVSLFLLNLAFFINVGHGLKGSDAACWARGAVFHYFLLCAFTWMGLEAFHLYLLVIKVFNTYFGHYFLKLSLVGWGLPALIVIGTGSANSYGPYAIRDKKNTTTLELCWFREKTAISALYVTVHGYFLITFLFSAVVLGLVAWKIFTVSSATAGKEKGQHWKGVLTLLGLSSLVGVTWGLAILTPLGLSTVYVFAVFTSLQGVFCLIFLCILELLQWSDFSSGWPPAQAPPQAH
ncbi:adhesion G protein-coupled receptor G3 isoform X2 [Kogia breviceps]|uniref:adhesion G protein-coupled receptor G3 isoform X2 n=1 Tax=Kogia breviceps TaxID=27615 RepID=UPI0034D2897A